MKKQRVPLMEKVPLRRGVTLTKDQGQTLPKAWPAKQTRGRKFAVYATSSSGPGRTSPDTRSHTGERPYKCQTCERTFTLKHSLVRHQRIHQKARHSKHQGKDSDKDEKAEEDSEDESAHSANNSASAPSTSNHVAVTRSQKESLSNSGKECSQEEKAEAEPAAEPSAPKEQGSPGETDPQSPAAIVQDLLELCGKRPTPILAATDGALQLLGME